MASASAAFCEQIKTVHKIDSSSNIQFQLFPMAGLFAVSWHVGLPGELKADESHGPETAYTTFAHDPLGSASRNLFF